MDSTLLTVLVVALAALVVVGLVRKAVKLAVLGGVVGLGLLAYQSGVLGG